MCTVISTPACYTGSRSQILIAVVPEVTVTAHLIPMLVGIAVGGGSAVNDLI